MRFVIVNGKEPVDMWKTATLSMLSGAHNPVLFRLAHQAHKRGKPRKTGLYRERHQVARLEGAHPAQAWHVHWQIGRWRQCR